MGSEVRWLGRPTDDSHQQIAERAPEAISHAKWHCSTRTLQELDALFDQVAAPETAYKVENNPFLPYVAALLVGYKLPEKAIIDITEMLRDGGAKIYLQQLGQLFHVMRNDADFLPPGIGLAVPPVPDARDKMAFVNLLAQVVMNMAPTKELVEGIELFKSEVLGS